MQENPVIDPLVLANQKLQDLQQQLVRPGDADYLEQIQTIQQHLSQAIENKNASVFEQPKENYDLAPIRMPGKDRSTGNDDQTTLLTKLASPPIVMLLTILSVLVIEVIGFFLVDLLPISSVSCQQFWIPWSQLR